MEPLQLADVPMIAEEATGKADSIVNSTDTIFKYYHTKYANRTYGI